jgi:hypothetical protein
MHPRLIEQLTTLLARQTPADQQRLRWALEAFLRVVLAAHPEPGMALYLAVKYLLALGLAVQMGSPEVTQTQWDRAINEGIQWAHKTTPRRRTARSQALKRQRAAQKRLRRVLEKTNR